MHKHNRSCSFWSNIDGFSVVDLLALAFTATYLFVAVVIVFGANVQDKIIILNVLNNPITIILGGYFIDQSCARVINKHPKKNTSTGEETAEDDSCGADHCETETSETEDYNNI